jgi:hypothetical protein
LVDFDGDGRLDLLSGSNCCDSNGFHLFRRNQDGSWAPRKRLELPYPDEFALGLSRQTSFVTAADWNGDGVPDLLWVGPMGKGILTAFGPLKENEPIAPSGAIEFSPQGSVLDFAVADWDQDGKPDLLVHQLLSDGTRKEGIYWYKNLGGPGRPKLAEGKLLIGKESLAGKNSSEVSVQGFCVCDWNNDGWPDLIVARGEGWRDSWDRWQYRGTVWLYLRE